jgi:hypothetical protein
MNIFSVDMKKQLDALSKTQSEFPKHISQEFQNLLVCMQSPSRASLHCSAEAMDNLMPVALNGLPVDTDAEITEYTAKLETDKKLNTDTVRF